MNTEYQLFDYNLLKTTTITFNVNNEITELENIIGRDFAPCEKFQIYLQNRIFHNSTNQTETESDKCYHDFIRYKDFQKDWHRLLEIQKIEKIKEFVEYHLKYSQNMLDNKYDLVKKNKQELITKLEKLIKQKKIKKKHVNYSLKDVMIEKLLFIYKTDGLWYVDEKKLN